MKKAHVPLWDVSQPRPRDGGATASSDGIGLAGLADRIAALDGELTVMSPPGEGTRLLAEIPLD